MAKSRKGNKPRKDRGNLKKWEKMVENNNIILKKYKLLVNNL